MIGKPSQATKQRDLSSDFMGTYNTTSKYGAPPPGSELVIDLDLRDLPESASIDVLK